MKQQRKRRVDEAVRHVVAASVEELADPALGFVTVTGVDVSADLEHATVRVSVLGGERRRRDALRGLDRARGLLQSRIGRELHLRRTPVLRFQYDEGVDRAMRINELLNEAGSPGSGGGSGETP